VATGGTTAEAVVNPFAAACTIERNVQHEETHGSVECEREESLVRGTPTQPKI
jgi:hypothetical protein